MRNRFFAFKIEKGEGRERKSGLGEPIRSTKIDISRLGGPSDIDFYRLGAFSIDFLVSKGVMLGSGGAVGGSFVEASLWNRKDFNTVRPF